MLRKRRLRGKQRVELGGFKRPSEVTGSTVVLATE